MPIVRNHEAPPTRIVLGKSEKSRCGVIVASTIHQFMAQKRESTAAGTVSAFSAVRVVFSHVFHVLNKDYNRKKWRSTSSQCIIESDITTGLAWDCIYDPFICM